MPSEDLRIIKTRKAIRDTFIEMRKTLPVEKIHVRELCRNAMINKSTFYNHYEDIFALENELEDEAVERFLANFEDKDCLLTEPVIIVPEDLENLFIEELDCRPIVIVSFRRPAFQTLGSKKPFRIFKSKLRDRLFNPTKEVTDIRAIQLNSSFTQVTFFRFIADRFKNIKLRHSLGRPSRSDFVQSVFRGVKYYES